MGHFIMLMISLIMQTRKLANLLNKYWSVELFWFPFNSIINRMLEVLPDMNDTELTISTASFLASHPIDTVSHICIARDCL